MMMYEEFQKKVVDDIRKKLGREFKVECYKVTKNNGIELDALSILSGKENMAPTIYLNAFYQQHCEGTAFDRIIEEIWEMYEKYKLKNPLHIEEFQNFEKAKKKICYKLIHYEKNKKLLKDVPHRRFLDLAVVYYCLVDKTPLGSSSILIYNNHLGNWGVDEQELYKAAGKTTPELLPEEMRPMIDVVRDLYVGQLKEEIMGYNEEEEEKNEKIPFKEEFLEEYVEQMLTEKENELAEMYVLSNELHINGAAAVLYEGVLEMAAERLGGDFYVLPSSLHELVLVPLKKGYTKEVLLKLVNDINESQVAEEEYLSDEVYCYSVKKGELKL